MEIYPQMTLKLEVAHKDFKAAIITLLKDVKKSKWTNSKHTPQHRNSKEEKQKLLMRSAISPPTPSSALRWVVFFTRETYTILILTSVTIFWASSKCYMLHKIGEQKYNRKILNSGPKDQTFSSDNSCTDNLVPEHPFPSLSGLKLGKESEVLPWPLSSFQISPDRAMCPT